MLTYTLSLITSITFDLECTGIYCNGTYGLTCVPLILDKIGTLIEKNVALRHSEKWIDFRDIKDVRKSIRTIMQEKLQYKIS